MIRNALRWLELNWKLMFAETDKQRTTIRRSVAQKYKVKKKK